MIKQILHTFVTKILGSAFGFATIIIVSQILGATQKGEQAMIVLNVYVLMLVFNLIGNSTLIYLTPRHRFSLLLLPSLLWISGLTLLSLLFAVLFPAFVPQYGYETLLIAVLASVSEINQFFLLGKEKIIEANKVKIVSPLLTTILLVVLWLCNALHTTHDFVLCLCFSYLVSTIYSIFLLKNDYLIAIKTSVKRKELLQISYLMLAKGATKQLGTIMQALNYRLLFYILLFYCGKSVVGVYSNAVSLTEAVLLFGTSLALVQYSKLSNSQDKAMPKQLTIKMTKINALFTLFALLVLCFMPSEAYLWLLGAGFEDVGYIIRLLAAGILLLSCASNVTQYFASQGNFSISAVASLIGLLTTLLMGLWLVPIYGVKGAALTSVCSFTITSLIELTCFLRWIKKEDRNSYRSQQKAR
ncbi:MAG: polysaccharide biosynthesis C-terminal domain-containing protein [Bacteroidales bacterium]|nr:polysaccharide biosynthesis C-terminal domain-containing protein [Bacteroidales bacterium]